jgi:hypothetical protein
MKVKCTCGKILTFFETGHLDLLKRICHLKITTVIENTLILIGDPFLEKLNETDRIRIRTLKRCIMTGTSFNSVLKGLKWESEELRALTSKNSECFKQYVSPLYEWVLEGVKKNL